MINKLRMLSSTIAFLLLLTSFTLGQVTGGAVTGTVLDATGAVVPNATVTLKSKTTGQELTTQTTGSGSYSYPNVAVGDYTITAVSTGFQTVNQDLRVSLNQTTSVDVTLQAGSIAAETVEVTAASEALVQTRRSWCKTCRPSATKTRSRYFRLMWSSGHRVYWDQAAPSAEPARVPTSSPLTVLIITTLL
jgi:hypothetical protein